MGKLWDFFIETFGVEPHDFDWKCDCLACALQRMEMIDFQNCQ